MPIVYTGSFYVNLRELDRLRERLGGRLPAWLRAQRHLRARAVWRPKGLPGHITVAWSKPRLVAPGVWEYVTCSLREDDITDYLAHRQGAYDLFMPLDHGEFFPAEAVPSKDIVRSV